MKRFLPILLLSGFSSPVMADITHSISSSVQLNVNAAATQVERIGNSYSVSGTNMDATTLGGMSVGTDDDGNSTGVASFTAGDYDVTDDATTWALTESWTIGDTVDSTGPDIGDVSPYSSQISTAGGSITFTDDDDNTSTLAGAIDSVGGVTVTPGGAGTQAIGQVTTSLTIFQ